MLRVIEGPFFCKRNRPREMLHEERSAVDGEAVKSFTSATLRAPLQKFASLTVFMRVHVLAAFVVTALCFLSTVGYNLF